MSEIPRPRRPGPAS